MVQKGSFLNVIDNSGIKIVRCVHVYSRSKSRYAKIGDTMLVSVRKVGRFIRANVKARQGDLLKAVLIRSKNTTFVLDSKIGWKAFQNGVVLLTQQNKYLGSRVFGYVPEKIRYTKHLRVSLMSAGVLSLS